MYLVNAQTNIRTDTHLDTARSDFEKPGQGNFMTLKFVGGQYFLQIFEIALVVVPTNLYTVAVLVLVKSILLFCLLEKLKKLTQHTFLTLLHISSKQLDRFACPLLYTEWTSTGYL